MQNVTNHNNKYKSYLSCLCGVADFLPPSAEDCLVDWISFLLISFTVFGASCICVRWFHVSPFFLLSEDVLHGCFWATLGKLLKSILYKIRYGRYDFQVMIFVSLTFIEWHYQKSYPDFFALISDVLLGSCLDAEMIELFLEILPSAGNFGLGWTSLFNGGCGAGRFLIVLNGSSGITMSSRSSQFTRNESRKSRNSWTSAICKHKL